MLWYKVFYDNSDRLVVAKTQDKKCLYYVRKFRWRFTVRFVKKTRLPSKCLFLFFLISVRYVSLAA